MTLSLALRYYGIDHDWTCPLLDQGDIDDISDALIASLETDLGMIMHGLHFDKETIANGHPTMVRR